MATFDAVNPILARAVRKAEVLDAETERELARAWRDKGDSEALDRLIRAYMRLAMAWASKYRRYGVPMADLVSEAALGLMRAAERFDPDRGVRFSTYANWWVKAALQDYTMRNWSLVRTGSTSAQKTLFFNFRRVEAMLQRRAEKADEDLPRDVLFEQLADEVGVRRQDVEVMAGRLSGMDMSLNAPQASEGESREWIETIADEAALPSETYSAKHDHAHATHKLREALGALTLRERHIVEARHLSEEPRSLESLGQEYGLSKERIRQIEAAAFGKLRDHLHHHAEEVVALL